MDEPSLGLGPMYVNLIFDIIRKINQENGTPISWWNRTPYGPSGGPPGYVMENGRITLEGTADGLLHNEDVSGLHRA